MIKIIGIGKCGNNILEFLKKQNFQVKKSNYDFISINDDEDIKKINFSSEDTIFSVSGFGGSTAGKLTKQISQQALDSNSTIKNIVILPFNMETNRKQANKDLEELLATNENVEVYANDDLSDDDTLSMSEVMKLADEKIFDRIKIENQVTWKNFIIEQSSQDAHYKALVTFWSKDFKITLIEPVYKKISVSHMPFMAPSRFDFKDASREFSSIQDIEEIGHNVLKAYIKNEK